MTDVHAWVGDAIGLAGLLFGFWQWHEARKTNQYVTAFLHGLKARGFPKEVTGQIDDTLARIDPQRGRRKAAWLPSGETPPRN